MKKLFVSLAIVLLLAVGLTTSAMAQPSGYTSGFQVQNLSSSDSTSITITFYNKSDGSQANQVSDTINASSSKTYFPIDAVSDGFDGSVVVQADQPVAAIANILGTGGFGGGSYSGFTAGSTTVNIPLVFKNFAGINSFFNVQNAGSADASVNVSYPGTSCTASATVKPGAAATFDQAQDSCLQDNFVGAATITSDQPIVASSLQVDSDSILASNGFTDATTSTNPVMPLVVKGFGTDTGIQIQNTGTADTEVTVSYTPTAGNPGQACTETKSITAGKSETFGLSYITDNCTTNSVFVGSAAVTANSASQPLAAVVNQAAISPPGPNSSAYNAFDPAAATASVEIPLIISDVSLGGSDLLFTGFNVVNVGSAATDVSCTFANSTATVPSTTLQPGGSLNNVQTGNATLGAGYVGSATCTASGGTIVGVVNQLGSGPTVGTKGDQIFTYEAVNR